MNVEIPASVAITGARPETAPSWQRSGPRLCFSHAVRRAMAGEQIEIALSEFENYGPYCVDCSGDSE